MSGKPFKLIVSLIASFSAGAIGSIATFPNISTWYADLAKPTYSPPNWLFGPVWTILYALMAVSLYLMWTAPARRSKSLAFIAFGAQLVLNALWSLVFFGLHSLAGGLVVMTALWVSILMSIVLFKQISTRAAWLLVPYLLWVSFAMALNIGVAHLNVRADAAVNSYESCVGATGSRLQLSYPSVCVTEGGKRFVEPSATMQPASGTLRITEWNATLPLSSTILDATYTYDGARQQIFLTTTELESLRSKIPGCKSGLHGLHYARNGGRLVEQQLVETLCVATTTPDTQKIKSIQDELRTAAASATLR